MIIIHSSFQPGSHALCDAPLLGSAHSGAPGEVNCTGCHSGTINTGPGSVLVDLGVPGNVYTPGLTYTATITIYDTGLNKFGFQVTILEDSTNTSTGAFAITDAVNTRLIPDVTREYVGNTPCGADADSIGELTWTFDWQAPATSEGTLTAYISALATNHNHNTSGDNTYTQTVSLTPEFPAGIYGLSMLKKGFRVYPNPASGQVTIGITQSVSKFARLKIQDVLGKTVMEVTGETGLLNLDFSEYPAGIYTISMKDNGLITTEKLIIQK